MSKAIDLRNKTHRIAFCGLLTAVMLVLGFVESLLPVGPVPGIKLGLSNCLLVTAIYLLGIPTSFLLMILKVTLSGFLFGNPSSMMYAFAGGLVSMIVMSLLSRAKGIHVVVVSMAGGLSHNVGQVVLAMLILKTPQLMYYMAVLMSVGMVCGALCGICSDRAMRSLNAGPLARHASKDTL